VVYAGVMSVAFKKVPATINDLLAIPENERFQEIIGGELVRKARSGAQHIARSW